MDVVLTALARLCLTVMPAVVMLELCGCVCVIVRCLARLLQKVIHYTERHVQQGTYNIKQDLPG
jgi:hypothetical protein